MKKTEKHREEKKLLSEIDTIKKSKDGNKDEKLDRILNSGGDKNNRQRPQQGQKRKAMVSELDLLHYYEIMSLFTCLIL